MHVLTVDYTQANASEVLANSIKETGFAVLRNHPINFQLIKEIYIEWEDFFNSKSRFEYLYDKEKQEGYSPYLFENSHNILQKELKEFYHLYPLGRYPKTLSWRTRDLFHQMNTLASTLLEWLELNTPQEVRDTLSMPLAEMIQDSPRTLLRILHYPALTDESEKTGAVRAAPHKDVDLLTLLPSATAIGQQVQDKQGRWHDIESEPGTIVVNAGDMLHLCTHHYYPSSTHQVVNPVGEERKVPRISMPLLLLPTREVRLSTEHTAGSYLLQRQKELGVV
jgi:isopenicillin N synthase-like dioxygenase